MQTFDIKAFTWGNDGPRGIGSVEVSDLANAGDFVIEGFHVRSSRTGVVKTFHFVKFIRDAELELLGWSFATATDDVRITVFND